MKSDMTSQEMRMSTA